MMGEMTDQAGPENVGVTAGGEDAAAKVLAGAGGKLLPNKFAGANLPEARQEFYWRRQAEKLQKEMEAAKKTHEAEANLLRGEKEEAQARLAAAEGKAARLKAIAEAGLPPDLAQLVPETDEEQVREFIEKLRPVAERLKGGGPAGTLTNPARSASGDAARLSQLGVSAGRGDRRALREYAHLREKMRRK
jgi:hypothetical protein